MRGDRIGAGEIPLKHCPTEEMLGDHFTKPVQGAGQSVSQTEIRNIGDPARRIHWTRLRLRLLSLWVWTGDALVTTQIPSMTAQAQARRSVLVHEKIVLTQGAVSLHVNAKIAILAIPRDQQHHSFHVQQPE
jgi:hypothetical protein